MPWPWLVFVRLQRVNHFCGTAQPLAAENDRSWGKLLLIVPLFVTWIQFQKTQGLSPLAFWTLMMFVHGPVRWQWTLIDIKLNQKNESRFQIFSQSSNLGGSPPTPNLPWPTGGFFEVTELVLSIYTRRERVPEAEELLLCSSHTTLEVPPGGLADFLGRQEDGVVSWKPGTFGKLVQSINYW